MVNMKSFKEFCKDTVFTFFEGPNLFNKTIDSMSKGTIRDVAKSLQ